MNSVRNGLHADLVEAGIANKRIERGLGEIVPLIRDGPEMPFRNASQLTKEQGFLVGAPRGDELVGSPPTTR
jgi:hypothetical protein